MSLLCAILHEPNSCQNLMALASAFLSGPKFDCRQCIPALCSLLGTVYTHALGPVGECRSVVVPEADCHQAAVTSRLSNITSPFFSRRYLVLLGS